jgi:hypothetical protein
MFLLILVAVFQKKNETRRNRLAKASIIYCCMYLLFTFYNKVQAQNIAETSNSVEPSPVWSSYDGCKIAPLLRDDSRLK